MKIDRIENENRDVTIKYEGLKGDYRILEEQYDLCKM